MDCVFCKIVSGEIPADKVWEDENFLAFLDIKPKSRGHTLLIPKKHYRWVWDLPDFEEYFAKVRQVAQLLQKSLKPEFMEMWVFGLDVPHAHVHLIPHYSIEPPKLELPKVAERIKKITKGDAF